MKMRSPQESRSLGRLDMNKNDDFLAPDAIDSSMVTWSHRPLTWKVPPTPSRLRFLIMMLTTRTVTNLNVLDGGIARVHRTTILD